MLSEEEREERQRLSYEAADLYFFRHTNKFFNGEFNTVVKRLKELNRKLESSERNKKLNPQTLKV